MSILRRIAEDERVMSGAVMTTYPFSPQFFEGTVLPALRDKDIGESIAVLVDENHYEATLTEPTEPTAGSGIKPPKYAGQRYHLAPVAAGENRSFHPKIHYITGERRVQVSISSANITHPGFTHNQEVTTSFTLENPTKGGGSEDGNGEENTFDDEAELQAAICLDIVDFFETLLGSPLGEPIDRVTKDTIRKTIEAGNWIQKISNSLEVHRDHRLIHNLNDPILSQVHDVISSHGDEIESVDFLVPFYGSSLRVPRQFTDDGFDVRLWLQQDRTQIEKGELDDWLAQPPAEARVYESTRYVHGKIIHILTNEAVYCISGSPNGSIAALLSSATQDQGNLEVAMLRREPELDYFQFLFNKSPFSDAQQILIDEFAPGEMQQSLEPVSTYTNEDLEFKLDGASYRQRPSYDGGSLVLSGRCSEPIRDLMETHETILHVDPSSRSLDPSKLTIEPRKIEWDHQSGKHRFIANVELYGESRDRLFSQTATVWVECDHATSGRRWIQTQSAQSDEPAAEDVEEAGARTVPRALLGLYQADADRRAEVLDSLNALLAALGSVDPTQMDQAEQTSDRDPGPRGGLRVRPWTKRTARDPTGLIESFYDGWEEDLRIFIRETGGDSYHFEEIATRLEAINSTTLHLLLLDRSQDGGDVPRTRALSSIKRVYSELDPASNEVTSCVGDYCAVVQFYAEQIDSNTEHIFNELRSRILPFVLYAAIIAEAHIAGDRETYFNQQDWAFERLIGECHESGYPSPDELRGEPIQEIVTTIMDATEGIRDLIEDSQRYRRYSDRRYIDPDHLEAAVLELLGRSILFAGPNAIETTRENSRHIPEIERAMEKNLEYLPKRKHHSVKGLF